MEKFKRVISVSVLCTLYSWHLHWNIGERAYIAFISFRAVVNVDVLSDCMFVDFGIKGNKQ